MTTVLELLARVLAPLESIAPVLLAPGAPLAATLVVGVLGAAAVLVATGLARVLLAVGAMSSAPPRAELREGADTRLLVWQRDPDADGHVRSRAPGALLAAA